MSETVGIITDDNGITRLELPKDHTMVCGWCGSRNLKIFRPVQLPPAPSGSFVCQCVDCGDVTHIPVIINHDGEEGYDKYGVKIQTPG